MKTNETVGKVEGLAIRFDGPPGPEAGRFVEVEVDGKSVRIGEWKQDGEFWLLVLGKEYAAAPQMKSALELAQSAIVSLTEKAMLAVDWDLVNRAIQAVRDARTAATKPTPEDTANAKRK